MGHKTHTCRSCGGLGHHSNSRRCKGSALAREIDALLTKHRADVERQVRAQVEGEVLERVLANAKLALKKTG